MITREKYQRIKEIFQSAQEKTPTERLDFLDQVCGDDPTIREEVDGLLRADESNQNFLSGPAYQIVAPILVGEDPEFKADQKIGRYTILCQLGAGGMGQIYLAHDEQLGRNIALKLIATEFATDPRRVLRFEQEARTASALNHPNVCVIHEIGVTDNNRHFIAMEHIQGITLREKLAQGPIAPSEALHITTHVAAALAAAHASRIIHRDIKPENIMLRPDGYVKVLDFGLAKLTEILPALDGAHKVPTRFPISTNVHTEAGTLMGTVKYMSPEQLREAELDERTDIWSLGIVLYEMLTRTTPFEGRTNQETIASIVGSQAPALSFSDEVPARLREIIKKALEKDRNLRYQTVSKLAADLEALKTELIDIPVRPRPVPAPYSAPIRGEKTHAGTGSAIFGRLKSQTIHTAEFLLTGIRSHKAATLAGMTVVLALLLYLPTLIRNLRVPTPPPRPQLVTNSGTAVRSAITSDGKMVAHTEEQDGNQLLMLTDTVAFASSVVVPAAEVKYLGLTFSRDNSYLYFTRQETDGARNLYRMSVNAPTPIKIKEAVDSPISFSPAGDYFAFVRLDRIKSEYLLIVSDTGGTSERVIATRGGHENFSPYGLSWSPDGSTIVCPAGGWEKGYRLRLLAYDLTGEPPRPIGNQSWTSVYDVGWQYDMSSLVISAREGAATPHQIWRISYPDGEIQRLTSDSNDYKGVSVAGDKIVTVQTDRPWDVWVTPLADFQKSKSIASGGGSNYGVSWTRKGLIVFSSMSQDQLHILRIRPDGTGKVQLTHAGDNYNPAASADGGLILFASDRGGSFNIWTMNAENGGDPKQLTFTDGNFYPSVSWDNQWVVYDNQQQAKLSIWKVPLQGGTPVMVADGFRMPVFSPDNKYIAGRYDHESGSKGVAIFPADGGEPVQTIPIPEQDWQRVYWIDNHTLSFIKNSNGYSNIWSYDLNTGTEKQLTHFNSEYIYGYAFSPDFKQVATQRGRKRSDVIIISSER